jgi:hypothetical protein
MQITDVIADVKFYNVESNGRKAPTPTNYFGCIFVFDLEKYDGRLLLENVGSIYPGDFKKNISIKFLSPEVVLPRLFEGKDFYLWEMKNIGEGKIVKIVNEQYKKHPISLKFADK